MRDDGIRILSIEFKAEVYDRVPEELLICEGDAQLYLGCGMDMHPVDAHRIGQPVGSLRSQVFRKRDNDNGISLAMGLGDA